MSPVGRRPRPAAPTASATAALLAPWDGVAPFTTTDQLDRASRSQILRSIIERHSDERGRPAAIRRVASRLGRSPSTLKAWMSNSSNPVPWLDLELLRYEDALLHSATLSSLPLPLPAHVRALYEAPRAGGAIS